MMALEDLDEVDPYIIRMNLARAASRH